MSDACGANDGYVAPVGAVSDACGANDGYVAPVGAASDACGANDGYVAPVGAASDACPATRRLIAGAAIAVSAALAITGCSTTTDGAANRVSTEVTGCASTGYSTAAATATVRCYLDALRTGDPETACRQLSVHARTEILASARGTQMQGMINISTRSAGCAGVATVIQHALDSLTPSQHAQLEHRLRIARVGAARVSGSTATVLVTIPGEKTTQPTLVRGPATWRIDSVPYAG